MHDVTGFTLRVNLKCQNVFFFSSTLAHSLTEAAAAQTGARRSEYLIQAECDWLLMARILMLLLPPRTCCVNLGARTFDPGACDSPFAVGWVNPGSGPGTVDGKCCGAVC